MNAMEIFERSYLNQLANRAHSLQEGFETSYHQSRLGQSMDHLVHFVRQSYLFQWLTAEPEPDVIVIDLRETITVGPLLSVLDRTVPVVGQSWCESRIHTLLSAFERRLRAQPLRLISLVFVVALATNTLLSLVTATVTPIELGLRVAALLLAVIGTQIRHSWAELTETRVYALAGVLLEPPEVPADDEDPESDESDGPLRR